MAGTDRKRKKRGKVPAFLLLIGTVILAASLGGLSAKYAYQKGIENKGASGQFYFTSDLLTENGKTYTLPADTTSIQIKLRNYEDELRWSDMNIDYSYTVQKVAEQGNDSQNQQTQTQNSETSGSGTIVHTESNRSEATIDIPKLSAGTYTVTAKTTAPFQKTLKGTFTIAGKEEGITYTVNDSAGSAYVQLIVSVKEYSGNVKISWPDGLIPDTTQQAFKNVKSYENGQYAAGSVTLNMDKYSSDTFRFFKSDTSQTYNTSAITAEKAEGSNVQ